jgi:hypothetical protein
MGIILLLTIMLVGTVFISVSAESGVDDYDSRSDGIDFDDPDIWYISDLKEIQQNITFELPIIINSSGVLRIRNSITLQLLQNYDFERNITVKDNGTLNLRAGSLTSNFALNIFLKDTGKLIVEKGSELQATKIVAQDSSLIRISSSIISAGKGGLKIDISKDSSIELIESVIYDADKFSAYGNSNVELRNGTINTKEFAINCNELRLISNYNLKDLIVSSARKLYIENSKVTGLQVDACNELYTSTNSKIYDSTIKSIISGKISSSEVKNLRFNSIDELEIVGSQVNILKINTMVTNLIIKYSDISQLDIERCERLKTYNSHLDNSKLKSSLSLVEFYSSEVEHCSIYPIEVKIYDSIIVGNEKELNDLTNSYRFEAYNSDFNSPLHFTGNSEAHLINSSTLNQIPPKVIVDDDAKVYIYWWLEVQVLDKHSKPLPETTVHVCDFITNKVKDTGISDEHGKVKFSLLANTITKNGWKTRNNKSYFIKGDYGALSTKNGTGIWMRDNTNSFLEFSDVKESKSKPKPFFTRDTIIGIFIFILIVILICVSLIKGRRSGKNGARASGRSPPSYRSRSYARKPSRRQEVIHPEGNGSSSDIIRDLEEQLLHPSNNDEILIVRKNNNNHNNIQKTQNRLRTYRRGINNNGNHRRKHIHNSLPDSQPHRITINRRLKSVPQ